MTAATWQDIPRGHYAIPIVDPDPPFATIGAVIYQRKRDRLVGPRLVGSVDVDWQTLRDEASFAYDDRDWCINEFLTDPDYHRANYGTWSGRCGICHRRLTDPDSKIRGIGPDCAKAVRT